MFVVMEDEEYRSKCGVVLKREYGKTPNGNLMNGRWVLRNPTGDMLGFDKYRHDLAEVHNLRLLNSWYEVTQ